MDAFLFNGVQVFLDRQFGEDQTAILKEARKVYCGRKAFYRLSFIGGVSNESIRFAFAHAKQQVELDIDQVVKYHSNKLDKKLKRKECIFELGKKFMSLDPTDLYDHNLLKGLPDFKP